MRTTSDVTRVCVSAEISGVISVCGDETEARAIYRGQFVCVEAARRLVREGTGDGGARGVLRGLCVIMQPQQTRNQLCVSVSVSVRFVTLTLASIQQAIQHQQLAAINLFL